jgi:hypothetical protein
MTTTSIPRPAPGPADRAVRPERPRHRHTAHCWWDVVRARWVCD